MTARTGIGMTAYLSDMRPDFSAHEIDCGKIPAYRYDGNLGSELEAGTITIDEAPGLLEDMMMIREVENMLVMLRSGAYSPIPDFDYRGPTHVSIGQEATSVGACSVLDIDDNITSTHRGHGDSIAKGTVSIRKMDTEQLRSRVPQFSSDSRDELVEAALEEHIFRTIAELFGKEDGYCRGRGGGMHIADFSVGHLGANAVVGGGVPIATGAALGQRYLESGKVVCCFAGDGAYANGAVLEALNFASQHQFTNHFAGDKKYGLPIIFLVINNHYGMTGRADEEVMGIGSLAQRAAGFADNNMHAEVVNGMDIMAVRNAMQRSVKGCRNGEGPFFIEADTYRYYGHSLSDPRNEYRTRDEENAWKSLDPIENLKKQLIECKIIDEEAFQKLQKQVRDRNARAAVRATESADPVPEDVIKYMYTDTVEDTVPEQFGRVELTGDLPEIKRIDGTLTYRDAIKEGIVEEMMRDSRVIIYGEDVADYGGAFKLTKGLLEAFGRTRVFNAPISEAAICGTGVGASMVGLRPVVELMYMDFALMAADQISNQAAKWHYMSGAQVEVPMVIRTSVGGGKGYGGQHSQTLETMFAHIPGLYVVYPSTPYDAKGMIKSAIRDNNPTMFVESQLLYGLQGRVPEEDYLVPLGVADIKRSGTDLTIVSWGPMVHAALDAAETLSAQNIDTEVVDLRSLIPLDMETVLRSVRKTGRCIVASQCVHIGSYTGEIASTIGVQAFDYLDGPVIRVGAKNGIAPQSHILEAAFLPTADDILMAVKALF